MRPFLAVVAVLGLGGCYFFKSASAPRRAERSLSLGPAQARGVVVFLPGFGDGPEAFFEHGLDETLREVAPGYDIVSSDAHFAYYRSESVLDRLRDDVIGPLRAQGYREVWLVGVSMGGLGSVGYANAHPEQVTGLLLLAPFLGAGDVLESVMHQGLEGWGPPEVDGSNQRFYRDIWLWLQRNAPSGRVYLGYGTDDGLAPVNGHLAEVMDPDHVVTLPGGHDWEVWIPAFRTLAERALHRGSPAHP